MPDINANLKNAHARAWSEVKEDDSLPNIDVGVLINFLVDMFKSDKKERVDIIKKYAKTYSKSFLRYGKIFSEDFFPKTINEILAKNDREEFRTLAENGFADCLVNASEEIIGIVALYVTKQIDADEFLIRMSKTGIGEVGVKVMKAFNIDPQNFTSNPQMLLNFAAPIMAYQGLMGAYREYSKALDDLRLARESRMRVEAECQRSIEMIRAYRMEAEQRVSEYMNEHLDAFQSGFAAMDQAILANDPDGYIAGNVQIQQMLGAEIQFTNQEEFDALMDSDEDFVF
jgi:hypothetical protein